MPAGCLVLVPLRSFLDPKTRLADVLTLPERADLARRLAGDVLDALDGWDVAVLTDDDDVIRWADQRDVTVARPGIAGLNAAVTAGAELAVDRRAEVIAVVHADLAMPDALTDVLTSATAPERAGGVTAVPDRHGDGTNVLVVPAGAGVRFGYGPGSFGRHRDEAARLGLAFVEVAHAGLGWDVDTPSDLSAYLTLGDPTRGA